MIDERMEELACLHAFDLLEGEDRLVFEKQLESDPGLRAFVEELRESTSALAFAASSEMPPPALRQRIMETMTPKEKSKPGKLLAMMLRPQVAWGLAASFAVFCLAFQIRFLTAKHESGMVSTEAAASLAEIQSLQQQIEAERILGGQKLADYKRAADVANLKIAKLVALTGNSVEAVAVAVWNPLNQEGMLTVEKLPQIQNDRDYQLWVVDPQYVNPVNGGVFTVDSKGVAHLHFHPDQPISEATQFAISLEKKGGVPKAEGPIVAAGSL